MKEIKGVGVTAVDIMMFNKGNRVAKSEEKCIICGAYTGSNSPYCPKHKPGK